MTNVLWNMDPQKAALMIDFHLRREHLPNIVFITIKRGYIWVPEPPPPHERSQQYRFFLQHRSGTPDKSQSYQASIQC